MGFERLTDQDIEKLIKTPKRVANPLARVTLKGCYEQLNYKLHALDDSKEEFQLSTRRNIETGMEDDYSCGLSRITPHGESLALCRYHGPSHVHLNSLEGKRLNLVCHIHRATKKYCDGGQKAEGVDFETTRYHSLQEALHCLVQDCCIEGLKTDPEGWNQIELFG